jgi:transposase InsO family protein
MVREPQMCLPALPGRWPEPSAQEAPRNVSAANRVRQPAASLANDMWSIDFVSDALFDSRRLRATVVDAFTREALAIDVDQSIKGEQVVSAMARISFICGAPRTIRADNAPEFISKALDLGRSRPRFRRCEASLEGCGGLRERRDAGLQPAP